MERFRLRRGRVAAAVLLPGLAALMTMTTPALGADAPERKAKMSTDKRVVPYGAAMRVRGRFPDVPNKRVLIEFHREGGEGWRVEGRADTNRKGLFRDRVHPPASGWWRARLANPPATSAEALIDGAGAPETVDTRTGNRRIPMRSRTRAGVSSANVVVGKSVRISGTVKPGGESRQVVIHAGRSTLKTRTSASGSFSKSWRPGGTGTYRLSVNAKGNHSALGSGDGAGPVQVFRPAAASWYGPGFYGHRTACGQTLTTSTLGVAHKTMPCGTKVTLRYNGREVTVPVIDRGPYAAGREYDLTSATKNRLGFGSTGTVLSSR